jgi:two-component system chemotaxis response regulator CheB
MAAKADTDGPARPIHVLVVDDSAIVRQAMTTILTRAGDMSVSVAPDPIFAREKMKRTRPDVIVLDIEMPRMDGLTFLRHIMSEDPIPVVVCSALTGAGTEVAFRALEEGAVEVITKPKLGVQEFLEESATRLVDTVRAATGARLSLLTRRHTGPPALQAREKRGPAEGPREAAVRIPGRTRSLVAIGASTGGTEALRELLQGMPADAPAIVIVQHMPERFTRAFAERLDQSCRIRVSEARDGERVRPGRALVAPGDRHLLVHKTGGHYVTEVRQGPLVSRHRPSVDVLFRSVAMAAGGQAVGVIMTGMGDDGAAGLLEMKAAGAATIAQDEATSVVFGMAREAMERGAVDELVPLPQLAAAVLRKARPGQPEEPDPD